VGQENRGLEYMFIMMNAARYAVGVQGIAIAERAYQKAVEYARDRVQSRPVDGSVNGPAAIIHHPDVRRMLMTMRAYTEGCRAMASVAAAAYDAAHHHPDPAARKQNQAFYEFLVPLVKGYSTEMSLEVTSLGVQVHGGMGFIEETGAAQYARDARITTIYEGTTGIQANDLIARKVVRDEGAALNVAIAQVRDVDRELAVAKDGHLASIGTRLRTGVDALADAGRFVVGGYRADPRAVLAAAVPFLELAGLVFGGEQLARGAAIAAAKLARGEGDADFMRAKIATARHFADHLLTQAPGLRDTIVDGAAGVLALADDAL